MASVAKSKKSKHWNACYKIPTGGKDATGAPTFRRVQRSTGTEDRSRALQMAISFERAAVAASEGKWSELAAHRLSAELSAVSGVSVGQVEPLEPFLARWLASRRAALSKATHAMYSARVRVFTEFLGDASKGAIASIDGQTVARWRDAELGAGKSGSTVNLSLTIIGQAFAEAVRTGLLTRNPCAGLTIRGVKKRAQKRSAFTFRQFTDLVKACDGEWRTFLLICGYTGARRDEAATVEWSQIDTKRKRITLERGKTNDQHWLPMHPALAAHFRRLTRVTGPVMPTIAKTDGRVLSKRFRVVVLPKIGLVQAYAKTAGKGRKLAEYSLHSLRHSLATWLHEAGVSEMNRMRIVGHADKEVSRGYTHTELARLAVEMAKLPSV